MLTIDLAKEMASKMMATYNSGLEEAAPTPESAPAASAGGGTMSQDEIEKLMGGGASAPASQPSVPQMPQAAQGMPQQGMPMQQMPYGGQPMGYPDPNMAGMYGMYPQQGYPMPPMNIQPIQLQSFGNYQKIRLLCLHIISA